MGQFLFNLSRQTNAISLFEIHEILGDSDIRLNDDPGIKLIGGSVPDVCLLLGPPWLNQGFSLALTIRE